MAEIWKQELKQKNIEHDYFLGQLNASLPCI